MVAFDSGPTLADRFRTHAGDRTHLYGHAMRAMAADWEQGGPVRAVCAGYEQAPAGAVLQLRLLAGVFRLVLTGQADQLRPYYPCLGGTADPAQAWPLMRAVIADHVTDLHEALQVAPQTNEVGRSAALLAGLFQVLDHTGATRIRLLELGASAGLNLLLDHFRFTADGWAFGPTTSPLVLADAIRGPLRSQPLVISERRGCDLAPIDPSTPEGQLLLTSFVWPFDLHRHARLRSALEVVAAVGSAPVDAAGAGDWLPGQLDAPSEPRELTVVWRSITQQYWPTAEVDRVAAILDAYGAEHPVATVSLEYDADLPAGTGPVITTGIWSGDGSAAELRVLGTAHDHGIPVVIARDHALGASAPAEPA